MIAVVQRVTSASVTVTAESYSAEIGHGLAVLLGVELGDADDAATWMAGKLARLRIFGDDQGKMNRSVRDVGGSVLLVSQFTLAGDCSKGNRPGFSGAAPPEDGRRLYDLTADLLRTEQGLDVATGIFGAKMQVALVNDGPVTLIVRHPTNPA